MTTNPQELLPEQHALIESVAHNLWLKLGIPLHQGRLLFEYVLEGAKGYKLVPVESSVAWMKNTLENPDSKSSFELHRNMVLYRNFIKAAPGITTRQGATNGN